jgi:hypothetical protein
LRKADGSEGLTAGWDGVRLKDSPLVGRAERDAPGETGRMPCRKKRVMGSRCFDNQGIEECLNRAPRGTEGFERGRKEASCPPRAGKTGKLSTRIPNKRNNVCSKRAV